MEVLRAASCSDRSKPLNLNEQKKRTKRNGISFNIKICKIFRYAETANFVIAKPDINEVDVFYRVFSPIQKRVPHYFLE